MGDVVPEVCWGDGTAEYPLGDTLEEIIFGVPVGVRRGVIYGVIENLYPAFLEAVDQITLSCGTIKKHNVMEPTKHLNFQ